MLSPASHSVKARHQNFCRHTSQSISSLMTNLSPKPSQASSHRRSPDRTPPAHHKPQDSVWTRLPFKRTQKRHKRIVCIKRDGPSQGRGTLCSVLRNGHVRSTLLDGNGQVLALSPAEIRGLGSTSPDQTHSCAAFHHISIFTEKKTIQI